MRKIALVAVAIIATVFSAAPAVVSAQSNVASAVKVLGLNDSKSSTIVEQTKEQSDPKVKAEVAPATAAPATPAPVMVTVQSGDSLTRIATTHSTTWTRLYDANTGIANPDVINPGDQIRIPQPDEQLAHRELPQTAAPAPVPAPTTRTSSTTTTQRRTATPRASYPVSSNAAKAFIYAHESGNNPNATSPNGCYGLGQDCNGVLRKMCGADYACQDAYFTRYAVGRYGSWEGAYAFWQSHHWW